MITKEAIDITALATTWMVENCPDSREFLNLQSAYKAGFEAALSTLPIAGEVPKGWQLVPKVPTPEIQRVLFTLNSATPRSTEDVCNAYQAILNLATVDVPSSPGKDGGQPEVDAIGPYEQMLRDAVEPFLDWLEQREAGAHIKEVREGLIGVEDVIPDSHVVLGAHLRAKADEEITIGHFRRLRDAFDGNLSPTTQPASTAQEVEAVKVERHKAKWIGDDDILPTGSEVEILAIDQEGLTSRDGQEQVPARTACWIRHWPRNFPRYRSCDLCDLDLSGQAFDQLYTRQPAKTALVERKFGIGDRVTKTKGSSWTGRVVGFYSTDLTPIGYAVESETETGSVQIYPEAALSASQPASRENEQ